MASTQESALRASVTLYLIDCVCGKQCRDNDGGSVLQPWLCAVRVRVLWKPLHRPTACPHPAYAWHTAHS